MSRAFTRFRTFLSEMDYAQRRMMELRTGIRYTEPRPLFIPAAWTREIGD